MSFQKFLEIPILFLFVIILGCVVLKPKEEASSKPVETKIEQIKEEKKVSESTPEVQSSTPITSPAPSHSQPPQPSKTVSPSPSILQTPEPPLTPSLSYRSAFVVWSYVNLRDGPGMNYKVIGTAKKGTSITILEEKGNWFRVRLENGKEAWMSKAATSEAPQPPPSPSLKPKPM